MSTGAMGIIKDNKMILIKNAPPVEKLVDFVIQFSNQNIIIIMSGLKTNGLFTTPLLSTNPEANMFVHSSHFANMKDLVYYFYLVFNYPHLEAYCKIVDSKEIVGLPPTLTSTVIKTLPTSRYHPSSSSTIQTLHPYSS